jgi:hypothetical protein
LARDGGADIPPLEPGCLRFKSPDATAYLRCSTISGARTSTLAVQSRSLVESAMLMLHSGRPYGTDVS